MISFAHAESSDGGLQARRMHVCTRELHQLILIPTTCFSLTCEDFPPLIPQFGFEQRKLCSDILWRRITNPFFSLPPKPPGTISLKHFISVGFAEKKKVSTSFSFYFCLPTERYISAVKINFNSSAVASRHLNETRSKWGFYVWLRLTMSEFSHLHDIEPIL